MQGSSSPAKKGLPAHSGGPQPCQVTRSRTRPTARRAWSLAGSRPMSRSSIRTCMVEFHPRFHAAPPHRPSAHWRASSRAPSAATSSAGAPIRSRITCQRIEGSESSSHRMTELCSFGACRLGGLVAIPNLVPIYSAPRGDLEDAPYLRLRISLDWVLPVATIALTGIERFVNRHPVSLRSLRACQGHPTPPVVRWKCLLYRGRIRRLLQPVVRRALDF